VPNLGACSRAYDEISGKIVILLVCKICISFGKSITGYFVGSVEVRVILQVKRSLT